MTRSHAPAASKPLSTFRIHHDDAEVAMVRAASPAQARADFQRKHPTAVIRKIKIDRQELRNGK